MTKDYQKEAWQLHIIFHREVLEPLGRPIPGLSAESRTEVNRWKDQADNLFDTLVMWIEEMQKEIYRLEGEIRAEKRRCGEGTRPWEAVLTEAKNK